MQFIYVKSLDGDLCTDVWLSTRFYFLTNTTVAVCGGRDIFDIRLYCTQIAQINMLSMVKLLLAVSSPSSIYFAVMPPTDMPKYNKKNNVNNFCTYIAQIICFIFWPSQIGAKGLDSRQSPPPRTTSAPGVAVEADGGLSRTHSSVDGEGMPLLELLQPLTPAVEAPGRWSPVCDGPDAAMLSAEQWPTTWPISPYSFSRFSTRHTLHPSEPAYIATEKKKLTPQLSLMLLLFFAAILRLFWDRFYVKFVMVSWRSWHFFDLKFKLNRDAYTAQIYRQISTGLISIPITNTLYQMRKFLLSECQTCLPCQIGTE